MEQRFRDSRYEIKDEISRGGRGVTYRAWDREKQTEVALKVFDAVRADTTAAAFHHDCSVWAGTSHPNLAELLDSGEIHLDGRARPFTATPIYQGISLRDLLLRYGRGLRPELVVQVVAQAARAVHALHQRGFIHRNLKPSKILVQSGGSVRVLDPGVGLGASIALTASIRTMPYMAPELLRMEAPGAASDIFALGAICYEAITNVQAFAGASEDEITHAVLEKSPAPPQQYAPGLSQTVASAVIRALNKDTATRFRSAEEFADALSGQGPEAPWQVASPPATRYEPMVTPAPVESGPPQPHDRAQDLDLLKRFSERAGSAESGKFAQRIRETTLRTAALYPGDTEIQRLTDEILNALDVVAPDAVAPVPPAPLFADAPAPPAPPPAPVAPGPPPAALVSAAPKKPMPPILKYGLIGAGVFIVLGGIFALTQLRSSKPDSGGPMRVEIRTTPPGARIMIGGEPKGISNLILDLPAATYDVVAELDGYRPTQSRFTVEAGKPLAVDIPLDTWLNAVRVTSEIDGATSSISGRPLASTSMGEYALEELRDGEYELQLDVAKQSAKIPMRLDAKDGAQLQGTIDSRGLHLVLLAMQGEKLRVYSANPRAQAGLDGKPPEAVPAQGIAWDAVRPGPHELSFNDGQTSRTIPIQITGAPVVHAFVFARQEADKGSLLVVAGVDDATVSINGIASKRTTHRGSLRLAGLAPGNYRVTVAKSGYEPAAEQRVEVAGGKEAKVEFALKPLIRPATLVVRHEPGTEVFVDGQVAATIRGEGTASVEVSPGSHRIELRRGSARSVVIAHDFKPGESWHPAQGTFTLIQPDGVIRFDITPGDARLAVRQSGEPESAAKPVSQGTISLPQGEYIVTATAPRHSPASVRFSSQPGTTVTVPVRLTAQPAEAPKAVARGVADFDDASGWTKDGEWLVRRGGNYVTYGPTNSAGTFTFTIQQRRGKRLQWFFAFQDQKNHRLFRLERKSLQRATVVNGKTTESDRRDLGFETEQDIEIRIAVERNRVVHSIRRSGQWVTVDDWRDPNFDFAAGKFGFYVPGGKFLSGADEYAIRGFSFIPAR